MRILHIVGGMNRGGVETWLMHVLRHIDRDRFQMDFLVHTDKPGAYDNEIRALGSQIIPCPRPSRPLRYARRFKRILDDYGPYDVVHSHVHHYSGWTLRLAWQAGVPVRIAHSHNDTSRLQAKAAVPRKLYLKLMKRWIHQYSTCGLAASKEAAAALFGANWQSDSRWQVLYCAIDLRPFKEPVDRIAIRRDLKIPADAFVIGHVGRFAEQKNHSFLVEIIREAVEREPRTWALLVGDGRLRPAIEQKVSLLGLAERVVFAGVRSDVPRLMLGAMDCFVFPSLYEGLGIVLVEAQAAGLPCVFSDVIPDEVVIEKELTQTLSLDTPASTWANSLANHATRGASIDRENLGHRHILSTGCSKFEIRGSIPVLELIYDAPSSAVRT